MRYMMGWVIMNDIGKGEHKLNIKNRKNAQISGVNDVKHFDSGQIILSTTEGGLIIKGDGLHVERLSLDKGEIDIDGKVDSLTYTDKGMDKGSLWERLFK